MNGKEKAQKGISLLEEAFLEEIKHKEGQSHTKIADKFDIRDERADKGHLQSSVCLRLKHQKKIKRGEDFIPPKKPLKGWWCV